MAPRGAADCNDFSGYASFIKLILMGGLRTPSYPGKYYQGCLDRSLGVQVNFRKSMFLITVRPVFLYHIIFQAQEPRKVIGRHAGRFPEYISCWKTYLRPIHPHIRSNAGLEDNDSNLVQNLRQRVISKVNEARKKPVKRKLEFLSDDSDDSPEAVKDVEVKWRKGHRTVYKEAGLNYQPPETNQQIISCSRNNPFVAAKCMRKKDCIHFFDMVFPLDKTCEHEHAINVSLNLKRIASWKRVDLVGCITPRDDWYLRQAGRDLSGAEKMTLQGKHYQTIQHRPLQPFSDQQLCKLAGDSINGFNFAIIWAGLYVVLPCRWP